MKYLLKCKDCGAVKAYEGRTLRQVQDNARNDGWAIARNNDVQWCPKHAGLHRNVGKRKAEA